MMTVSASAGVRLSLGRVLATIAVSLVLSATSKAEATSLRLGDLTFGEVSGDFQITGGQLNSDFYTIRQDVFGPNVNLLMSIDGFPRLYPYIGIQVRSIVTNRTGTPWIFFDHELREDPNVPSPEADGLSFAQGISSVRPFTGSGFSRTDEVTDVRDFINFSGGTIVPGASVVFQYAITDRSPINRFYLLERPNFAPGGAGFISPQPQPSVAPPIQPPIVTGLPPGSPTAGTGLSNGFQGISFLLTQTPPPAPVVPSSVSVANPPVAPPPPSSGTQLSNGFQGISFLLTQTPPPTPIVSTVNPSVNPPVISTPPSPEAQTSPEEIPLPAAAAVPEPSTLLGLAVAIAGGAAVRRTRSGH